MHRNRLLTLWLFLATVSFADAGDTLKQYAQQCEAATSIPIEDFNCDTGTLVPSTHVTGSYPNAVCDRPNQLNQECDPGSRFQVLPGSNDRAYAVAHCRKRGHPADNGKYRDIAVIQHNKDNGATCFYQALGEALDGNVTAPKKETWPWYSPSGTAAIQCARCHDSGPLVRSPYLAQLTGPNKLPGAGENSFNSIGQRYSFVGTDFAQWKVYQVEVVEVSDTGQPELNRCNKCHRMGVSNVGVGGTARDFGIRATALQQVHKNPHSGDSPIWMTPGQITFSDKNLAAATAIEKCAIQFKPDLPLPNETTCKITQFGGPYVQLAPVLNFILKKKEP
jgi:hypothetical protein